jgi:hypothetical protein
MPPLPGLKDSLGVGTTNMSLLTELPANPLKMSKNIRLHPAKRDYAGQVGTLATARGDYQRNGKIVSSSLPINSYKTKRKIGGH